MRKLQLPWVIVGRGRDSPATWGPAQTRARLAVTIQKAMDWPLMRSPMPPQLASLEHRYVMILGMHGVPFRWSSVHNHVLMMCCIRLFSRCFPADRCAAFSHLRTTRRDCVSSTMHTVWAISNGRSPPRKLRGQCPCERLAWCQTLYPGPCRTA